jgi:hypothetical protein
MAPNLYEVFHSDVTTYYSTQAAYPSSPLHLSTQSSLHGISALTCDTFTLAQRQTRTPLPICNWFNKQWFPPPPMKGNNNGTPPTYVSMNDQAQSPTPLTRAPLWLPFTLLLCFILMATFFTSQLFLKWNCKRIQTTRKRQQRWQQITWKYIYNSDRDKELTWTNKRYVYPKRKNYNTFPQHAQPLQVHWHGISFLVDNQDCWTKNTSKAIPETCGTPPRRTNTDQRNLNMEAMEIKPHHHAATLDTCTSTPQDPQASITNKWNPTSATKWKRTPPATNTTDTTHLDNLKGKQQQRRQHKQWKQHIWTTQKVKPKQATNTLARHPRQHGKDIPRDSNTSSKWHPQERFNPQWTKQHLDAYLALAEVLCEWNIEPG